MNASPSPNTTKHKVGPGIAQYNAARQFGINSLYGNDVTKQMNAMSRTINADTTEALLEKAGGFSPLNINELGNIAFDPVSATKKKNQRGAGAIYGSSNLNQTSYAMGHGDPLHRRNNQVMDPPTHDEMRSNYSSITKERYNEIMKAKPYVPRHHLRSNVAKNDSHISNILSSSFLQKKAKDEHADLAEIEW